MLNDCYCIHILKCVGLLFCKTDCPGLIVGNKFFFTCEVTTFALLLLTLGDWNVSVADGPGESVSGI